LVGNLYSTTLSFVIENHTIEFQHTLSITLQIGKCRYVQIDTYRFDRFRLDIQIDTSRLDVSTMNQSGSCLLIRTVFIFVIFYFEYYYERLIGLELFGYSQLIQATILFVFSSINDFNGLVIR
jgi:hypothetical protein